MHKIFMPAVVIAALAAPCPASSATMVVRTADGSDKFIELSHISEVVFDDEMVCVKMTSGTDFTMADSQFISFRFNTEGDPSFSSIGELTAESDATTVYDLNGRPVGNSSGNLASGIYLIVKPGCKVTKLIVK